MYQEYVDAGFRVFGLFGVIDGACECGNPHCKALYKHPRNRAWQKIPRWSQEQLDTMEEAGNFKTGFGVLCDGWLVVDIDPRNGGDESYRKLCHDVQCDLIGTAGLVVRTGGGGWHIYYKWEGSESLSAHLSDYPGIDFKSSGFVVGYGSLHASGAAYEIERGDVDNIGAPPEELAAMLIKPETYRVDYDGRVIDVSGEQVAALLPYISPDEYDTWVKVGMAIHHTLSGGGFELWDQWSQGSNKYNPEEMDWKWHSFGKSTNLVTYGTLHYLAEEGGYVEPVTFECDSPPTDPAPYIDIYKPPGIAGELCDWINSQCRYPRERLAAIASIVALGNIAGLKYECADYGVTTNLFAFCVAGSATGKEAVLQATGQAMREAGCGSSIAGAIKSEQEIIRTLVEQPQACYLIDEIGFLLKKIKNAQTRGGASYLEGVIGMLMSAYSKAAGALTIGIDQRKEAEKLLSSEIAALVERRESNLDYDIDRLEIAQAMHESIRQGFIDKPFLSLMGFATPISFDESVDHENATNGFFGRALIVPEPETNPKIKRGFRARPMHDSLRDSLVALHFGSKPGVDRVAVPTTQAALDRLEAIQEELHELAESYKQSSMEAIPRRGFEQILKISLIVSLGDGVRDMLHVEYAYALVKADIQFKANLAASNTAEAHRQRDEELLRRIVGLCDHEVGITLGVVANRLRRKFSKVDIQKGVEKLLNDGKLTKQEQKPQGRGRPSARLYLA